MSEDRHVIERYTLPEMGQVWSEAHKYELWCRVETLVPPDCVEPVRKAAPPTPDAVAAVEATTDHDVVAFLTAWADNTSPRSAAAYVHYGMTSSDLLDTALAVQLTEATDILLAKADALVATLREHALAHAGTVRAGRTHGIHAEPDTWGHRVADSARMRDNLDATGGLIYTSAVLLELVSAGMSREASYALVQAAAADTWQTGTPLRETLRKRAAASGEPLNEARLDDVCRPERFTARLGQVFERLAQIR